MKSSYRAVLSFAIAIISFALSNRLASAENSSGITIGWGADKAASANAAIMAYLGDPVPPPARIDPKYTAEGLLAAFQALAKRLDYKVQKLAVDDTEFPFLVYGVIEGRADHRDLQTALRSMSGYAYSGSTTGSTRDGSTYFSLNMMPTSQYPRSDAEAIRRRLMIRLQMLGVIWKDAAR